jgi:hypothetical protein
MQIWGTIVAHAAFKQKQKLKKHALMLAQTFFLTVCLLFSLVNPFEIKARVQYNSVGTTHKKHTELLLHNPAMLVGKIDNRNFSTSIT